ncbi:MAG: hypothetical protein A2503_10040 [Burkholderiales bacterium RIFOXYD12_FULL_59_19]|nr:MAG: hypothetical protein A2503_10040 [Burkholderiales bacterium RIFOXYD12_FULL_59_19]
MNKLFSTWWFLPLLMLAWIAFGFYSGYQYSDNAWQARQAQQARAQALAVQAEQLRSQKAARQAIDEQLALQKSYSDLKEKFDAFTNRGPLVVWHDGVRAACATGVVPGGAVAPGRQPETQTNGGPAAVADDAGAAVSLSAGSVWLWNSALVGADTPAGACGAADPTNPACALDAGVSIAAAWANHTANAQACASDRLRHQRLIDYIAAQGTAP